MNKKMKYEIPEVGTIEINTIVLDLNGTLTVKGKIAEGVKEKIDQLKKQQFKIILFTGNQRKNAENICKSLGISFKQAKSQAEKEKFLLELDPEKTASIGNARIDIGTFRQAKLAIATLQAEGIHSKIIEHVDIIVPSITDALDLFLDKNSLIATMRV